MATLMRVRAVWTGAPVVGGGVTTLYFADGGTGVAAGVQGFFNALKPWLNSGITVDVSDTGDLINDASGAITGSWTQSAGTASTGTGGGSFAQGVGGRVTWETGARRGRRMTRGATYIAPLTTQAYGTDGLLTGTFTLDLRTAALALMNLTTNELRVWSRPHKGAEDGGSTPVTGVTISATPSWLSSRKH